MASVRTLAPIKLGGGWLPPGSVIHDASAAQLKAWGRRVEEIEGEATAEAPGSPVAAVAAPQVPAVDFAPAPALEPDFGPTDDSEGGSRIDRIAAAVDILDPDDFDSDGNPLRVPLAAVLGFDPTAEELRIALGLREEQGL